MKKTKILFVDDDRDFSEANKIMLEQAGFEVTLAYTGKDGLDSVKKDIPDLVVLDVMLPDINGFSVCRELKEDPRYTAIPIILVTSLGAGAESYTETIGKEHKADRFLSKPVSSATMVAAINELLTKAKPVAKAEGTKAKILIIDDDADFITATKQILTANKYEVVTARDGDEGIAKARHENPDLILLDVMMPGKDGFSVCYEMRKLSQTRPIPVIMITSVGQQFTKPEYAMDLAIDHLADDYIEKPLDTSMLLKKIEKHLLFHT